ncbi:MOSC domain-containing protein [Actinomadura sp. NBRC 104425]|uniref:MOSC domain-containing protein n=1 Tax=Actinomadura sp. NBRC 104425 TaxID=3032204 RepID=UPI0024A49DA8|nr:MOSC N-terminal beta barrel domain-containing protein [Actinomadura sp. NBRC 104425]GLZ14028.1 MOSC domain-containing protein [Actinomadura sp. NBRC 104425]
MTLPARGEEHPRGVLTELNVYPFKSGRGTSLHTAELTPTGLPHDREFMLVTPEGRFLSQRDLPRMALLRPSYDGVVLTVEFADPAAGVAPLVHKAVADGPVREVYVHRSACEGIDQGDEAAAWFSAVLGTDCRMVRFTGHRATSRGDGRVAFADAYPLLVISAESLADLNARLAEPLPMNRFRPNLVIEGLGAFAEDSVRLLRVGPTVIELVKACARCVITTTDQDTGVRGREPLRTLASYRTIGRGIRFGQNGVPRTLGTLTVGDPVEVLAAR